MISLLAMLWEWAAAHPWFFTFLYVFAFRYIRSAGNLIGYVLYQPIPIPKNPNYGPSDVSVVIPTTNIMNETFHEVVKTILVHPIHALIVPLAGADALLQQEEFKKLFPDSRVILLWRKEANRRHQTMMAVRQVKTKLIISSDDHTYWPSGSSFVASLVAPFEDSKIGAVGPVLHVKNHQYQACGKGFWDFMGCTYLLRRSYEFLATNTIDGGLSCLSGRFSVFRASIYKDSVFEHQYLNEYIHWLGKTVGPLNADEEKFMTRWLVNNGWRIKIQGGPESILTTELGEWPKFWDQLFRWNRTTYRSNPRALVQERTQWYVWPYTTYTQLIYSFFRFSLFCEMILVFLMKKALTEFGTDQWFGVGFAALMVWCTLWKLAKVLPHFIQYPRDVVYFPGYLIFGWICSFVKVYCICTLDETRWGTADKANAKSVDPATVKKVTGDPEVNHAKEGTNQDCDPMKARLV